MLVSHKLLCFSILALTWVQFASGVGDDESKNGADSKSLKSVATSKSTTGSTSTSVTSSTKLSASGSGRSHAKGSSSGLVLNFDSSEIGSEIEVSASIPGILKYSGKDNKNISKIIGKGKDLTFSKKITHVYCNSPFDNNITVVLENGAQEQYVLTETGFAHKQDSDAEYDSASDTEGPSDPKSKPKKKAKPGLELNLESPSNDFKLEEVGKIKCYKPKEGYIVSKIIKGNASRTIDTEASEMFVCLHQDGNKGSIMVAYLTRDKIWNKYTLSLTQDSILLDVSLVRKFDPITPEIVFADKSSPDDNKVFNYNNLKVNGDSTGVLKSRPKGSKQFELHITDKSRMNVSINIDFGLNFRVPEGFSLHAIRTDSNHTQLIFTYICKNIALHEKYSKVENRFMKDLASIDKHSVERTKSYFNVNTNPKVLYLKTLVPDSVEQGVSISHHGKFKILDFKGLNAPSFVIFPNLEFYLDNAVEHRLVLCENGNSISFVMNTVQDNKRVEYIVSTDHLLGNPLAIKAKLEPN